MLRAILIISIATVLWSCGTESDTDFREKWVGTYEGTKSNRSFDDSMFTTPISFEVTLDVDSEDGLIVNGINFPISEEGTYGPDFLDGGISNYELTINGDELRLEVFGNIPEGIFSPCYIIGVKQ